MRSAGRPGSGRPSHTLALPLSAYLMNYWISVVFLGFVSNFDHK